MNTAEWIEQVKQEKEQSAQTKGAEFRPRVMVELGGEAVCIAEAPVCDRDAGLTAAAVLRAGFDPDKLVFVSDAFHGPPDHHLKRGDLQKQFSKGVSDVGEVLICFEINRDGTFHGSFLPYVCKKGHVSWEDPQDFNSAELGGENPGNSQTNHGCEPLG